jgi:hypothetical protein
MKLLAEAHVKPDGTVNLAGLAALALTREGE